MNDTQARHAGLPYRGQGRQEGQVNVHSLMAGRGGGRESVEQQMKKGEEKQQERRHIFSSSRRAGAADPVGGHSGAVCVFVCECMYSGLLECRGGTKHHEHVP